MTCCMTQLCIVTAAAADYADRNTQLPPTQAATRVCGVAHNQKLAWMACPSTALPTGGAARPEKRTKSPVTIAIAAGDPQSRAVI